MHSDRELLEYAAKAAGVPLAMLDPPDIPDDYATDSDLVWDPLRDPGQALVLGARTGVLQGRGFELAWTAMYAVGKLPKDPVEATCRAIVMAAAEIGRLM